MDFKVLGRVRVVRESQDVELGSPKQRLLLAVLLSRAGEIVSTASLIDALWGAVPPASAVDNTYLYVSRLRRALGPNRLLGGRKRPGYSLEVRAGEVDAWRFYDLAAAGEEALGRGDVLLAARVLREGLAIWDGNPYAEFADEPSLRPEVTRLTERRLLALEHRIAAELRLGRFTGLIDELFLLVDEYPYRERFVVQLMEALYRSGRQAEALATYRRARDVLREQLGLEPGAELRRFQHAILTGDPALEASNGHLMFEGTARPTNVWSPVPAQLPADIGDFAGRDAELAWMDQTLAGADPKAPLLVTVAGPAGVGKTALAVRWGHRAAHRFPDGQLFVNLQGFGPGAPVDPASALAAMLGALGVPRDTIPPAVSDAAAVYRSALANRRMLIILDNAATASQVRPLLPGSGGCVVVATSRERLSGLVARDGGRRLTLDVLDPDAAVRLIEGVVGPERVRREKHAARSLAALCGYLPLALRISAANVLDARGQAIGAYVAGLRTDGRMSMLAVDRDEDSAILVAFDYSYRTLPPKAQRALRMLGLVPGPDVTREALAALLDTTVHDAQLALDRLSGSHLVTPSANGRYHMHDLVREYAQERAMDDGAAARLSAVRRLNRHYLAHANAAARVLDPTALRLPATCPDPAIFRDNRAARDWLDLELPNLVAAVLAPAADGDETIWLLADALRDHFWKQQNATDAMAVAQAGLTTARTAGDRAAQASMLLSLGQAHATAGRYGDAAEAMRQAATVAGQAGWSSGEAAILSRLGDIHIDMGLLPQAGGFFQQALVINEAIGSKGGQAHNRNGLGGVELQMGRPHAAAAHYTEALELYRASGSTGGEAIALTNLATIDADLGRLASAADGYKRAIQLYRQVSRIDGEVCALIGLAAVQRDAGMLDQAAASARGAVTLLDHTDDSYYRAAALNTLGSIERLRGNLTEALTHHVEAVELARHAGVRYLVAETLLGLAEAHEAHGDADAAMACASSAIAMACDGEFRALEGRGHVVLANVRVHQGDNASAEAHARKGLALASAIGHRLSEARALLALGRAAAGNESAAALRAAAALLTECGAA